MHTMSNCLHPYGPQQARLLCPWDSRQEYLTGLLCPSPGDLPYPGIGPTSLTSTCIGRWVLYHEHHLGSPWDIWFSLINNNLLMFRLPKTFEKFLLPKFRTFGVFLQNFVSKPLYNLASPLTSLEQFSQGHLGHHGHLGCRLLGLQWKSSVVSSSLQPHGRYSLWNSLGQNTGVGSLSLLKGIFPTEGSNPGHPHC